jgi:hypothetical protein
LTQYSGRGYDQVMETLTAIRVPVPLLLTLIAGLALIIAVLTGAVAVLPGTGLLVLGP